AQGADVMTAEIIKNLESADMVLCDISTWNPNVFFELGIRTALNKPVCIVKDAKTERPPFDIAGLNYHSYSDGLYQWEFPTQLDELSAHLIASWERSSGENTLWKRFGLTIRAEPLDSRPPSKDERLEY